MYYTAPLSTVWTVLRTRNASSLYWPLSTMNVINGALWTGALCRAVHGMPAALLGAGTRVGSEAAAGGGRTGPPGLHTPSLAFFLCELGSLSPSD